MLAAARAGGAPVQLPQHQRLQRRLHPPKKPRKPPPRHQRRKRLPPSRKVDRKSRQIKNVDRRHGRLVPRARREVIIRTDSRKSLRTIDRRGAVHDWQLAKELVTCRVRFTKSPRSNKSARVSTPTSRRFSRAREWPTGRDGCTDHSRCRRPLGRRSCRAKRQNLRHRLRRRQLHATSSESSLAFGLRSRRSQPTDARSRE